MTDISAEEQEWLDAMLILRRVRQEVLFSKRIMIDSTVRPRTEEGHIIAYPDAIYYIKKEDVDRAIY